MIDHEAFGLINKDPAGPAGLQAKLTDRTVLAVPQKRMETGGLRRFSFTVLEFGSYCGGKAS